MHWQIFNKSTPIEYFVIKQTYVYTNLEAFLGPFQAVQGASSSSEAPQKDGVAHGDEETCQGGSNLHLGERDPSLGGQSGVVLDMPSSVRFI